MNTNKSIFFIIIAVVGLGVVATTAYYLGVQQAKDSQVQDKMVPPVSPTVVPATAMPTNEEASPSASAKSSPSKSALPSAKTTYSVPSNWRREKMADGKLTVCLMPKWETDHKLFLYYNRDAGYRPDVMYLREIPYTTGSRHEAYLKFWENENENVRKDTKFVDYDVNGNSVIDASGGYTGEHIIWYANGTLWAGSVDGWRLVNDNKSRFLSDLFTTISCSF